MSKHGKKDLAFELRLEDTLDFGWWVSSICAYADLCMWHQFLPSISAFPYLPISISQLKKSKNSFYPHLIYVQKNTPINSIHYSQHFLPMPALHDLYFNQKALSALNLWLHGNYWFMAMTLLACAHLKSTEWEEPQKYLFRQIKSSLFNRTDFCDKWAHLFT